MADAVVTVERERRGQGAYWVHLTGTGRMPAEASLNRRAGREARKWADEMGAGVITYVSGGGSYGNEWRHSRCYVFAADDK